MNRITLNVAAVERDAAMDHAIARIVVAAGAAISNAVTKRKPSRLQS